MLGFSLAFKKSSASFLNQAPFFNLANVPCGVFAFRTLVIQDASEPSRALSAL